MHAELGKQMDNFDPKIDHIGLEMARVCENKREKRDHSSLGKVLRT
jgi:hypothetical protein